MRRAATDQENRIGSLFLNPGGPGGSGYGMPLIGSAILEPKVLERFDLIGFDPRGVARSAPLRCFTTEEDAGAVFSRISPLPVADDQEKATIEALGDYRASCRRVAGPLLQHMATKDVARDLDLLRAAVGDSRLTYVGFSYGTLLGATYANLFPQRTRALVLDGNVDPELRLRDGLEYDRQRTRGFEIALGAYLARCDVDTDCVFGPDARAKFTRLHDHLRQVGPITLPDGTVVDEATMIGTVASILYNPAIFGQLAEALQALYATAFPPAAALGAGPGAVASGTLFAEPPFARYDVWPDAPYVSDDSYAAVNCSDKPFKPKPEGVPAVADRWERQMPDFGRYLAWADPAICPAWPVRTPDAYRGPWSRRTTTAVLLFGNYFDPATRYAFSKRMARELGNARLVSVDSFGHTILGASSCAEAIATDYLIDLTVPPPGTVCQPNTQPF
jgi:pimeloyl-ACP methyl ester carboxylesterase